MAVAGALLLSFGVALVVVAIIFVILGGADQRQVRRLRRAARPALGELANAAALPRRVLVTGRVAPGPDGTLVSPAFGTPCVWYDTSVTSDRGGEAPSRVSHLSLGAGGPAITVADGTGSVQVDLGLVLAVSSHDRIERTRSEAHTVRRGVPPPDGSGLATLERAGLLPDSTYPRFGTRLVSLSEVTIGPGVEVSVVARPRRPGSGTVVLQRRGALSAGSPGDWIARLERDVATAYWGALILPVIGLALFGLGVALLWAGVG